MMNRFMPAILASTFAFISCLTNTHAASLEVTKIPSSIAGNDKELWKQVMAGFYGKYDRRQKCWVRKAEGKSWCMRPHTLHRVSDGAASLYFMAIGGGPLGEANDCHACAGALGLLVLTDAHPNLGVVAKSARYMDYGSWGKVPAEESFAVHRIGAPANFAWAIENGWTGQGVTATWTDLFGIIGDQVKSIGQLPAGFSDEGNCDNGVNLSTQEKCTAVSFETLYAASRTDETFASIMLKGSGTLKGETFGQNYTVDFDRTSMSYKEPADFPAALKP